MPYRPPVYRGGEPGKKAFTYLLTGRSCLAGDVIGEYSFDVALGAGEQVVFEDMALYTMVKTNTFNGMPLPLIAIRRADGTDEVCLLYTSTRRGEAFQQNFFDRPVSARKRC